jgi:hypothetical protein
LYFDVTNRNIRTFHYFSFATINHLLILLLISIQIKLLGSGSKWPKEQTKFLMYSRYARNLYNPKIKRIFEIAQADFEIFLFIHFYPLKLALGQRQKHFINKFLFIVFHFK